MIKQHFYIEEMFNVISPHSIHSIDEKEIDRHRQKYKNLSASHHNKKFHPFFSATGRNVQSIIFNDMLEYKKYISL